MHVGSSVQNLFILHGYSFGLRVHFFIIKKQILREVTIVNTLRLWFKLRMLIHHCHGLLMFVRYAYSLQISRILHLWITNTVLKASRIDLLLRLTFKKFIVGLLIIVRWNDSILLLLLLLAFQSLVVSKLIENNLFIHTAYSIFRIVIHFVLIYI